MLLKIFSNPQIVPRQVNPYVKYRFCVKRMCQGRFISWNNWIILVGVVDSGGGYVFVGAAGSVWVISVPAAQFCCEPETEMKNKVYFKKYISSFISDSSGRILIG